jgi:hypothetical protein
MNYEWLMQKPTTSPLPLARVLLLPEGGGAHKDGVVGHL